MDWDVSCIIITYLIFCNDSYNMVYLTRNILNEPEKLDRFDKPASNIAEFFVSAIPYVLSIGITLLFDMIVTTYHDKPLMLSGAKFRERSVSHQWAMVSSLLTQRSDRDMLPTLLTV